MDDTDEREAQELASKWVSNIFAKVGVQQTTEECHSSRQVHRYNDGIDQNEHKRSNSAEKDEVVDSLHASNEDYSVADTSNNSQRKVVESTAVSRPMPFGKSSRRQKLSTDLTDSGFHDSTCELKDRYFFGKYEESLFPAERVTMRADQNIPTVSNEELFDIWEFDDQQKQTAKCYLRKPCIDSTLGKENLPSENANNIRSTDCELNSDLCKVCPDCMERNNVSVNWCEECGKALIRVEATKIDRLSAISKPAAVDGTEILKMEGIFASKLNPNCAEFVSAYGHSSPSNLSNGHSKIFGSPATANHSLNHADQHSDHFEEKTKQRNLDRNFDRVTKGKNLNGFISKSFTESLKFERKNDKSNKKFKQNRKNRRRSSSVESDSFGHLNQIGDSNSRGSQSSHSFSPRGEYQHSPLNMFMGHQHLYNQPHSYHATTKQEGYDLQSCSHGHYESGPGPNVYLDRSGLPFDRYECGNEGLASKPDSKHHFQGLDFNNPPIDNPNMLGAGPSFNEAEFSKSFVQNALNQQFEYLYGPSSQLPNTYLSQHWSIAQHQPTLSYHETYPPTPAIAHHRAYQKKKIVENGIESPRASRNLLKNSKYSLKNEKEKKIFGTRNNSSEKSKSKPKDVAEAQSRHPSAASETKVPPLKLEDLDNYDQVLTLIRTSREEALPYLCLPEEIILYIFSYLTMSDLCQCARVCQQFHRISVDESLWKEISIKKRRDLTDETLKQIAQKSPISLSITQCHSKQITEQGIRSLFQICGENLLDLDFSACSGNSLVGELILLHISTRCRNLRSLDISWSNVSDIGIQAVCESVTRLECLCMNGCQAITDEATRSIANRHSESIRVLEMFGCFNITQVSLMIIKDSCPNLETLNIGQCHKVSNKSVAEVAQKTTRLENIDLRGCKQIKDSAIKELSSNCPYLSTLVIANCPFITDASLLTVASGLSNIRCIDVCGCPKITDKGIQALAKSCAKLKMFDLSSTRASDKAVMSLANYCFQTLESLKMSFCHNITEISLEHLVKKCTRLNLLHLYGCKRIKNLSRIQKCRETLKIEN